MLHVDTGQRHRHGRQASPGRPVAMTVDANTEFFFRSPARWSTPMPRPIAHGHGLHRQSRSGARLQGPRQRGRSARLADWSPRRIEIETAAYDGRISAPDTTGLHLYARLSPPSRDDYVGTRSTTSAPTTPNGTDPATAMQSPATSGGTLPTRRCSPAAANAINAVHRRHQWQRELRRHRGRGARTRRELCGMERSGQRQWAGPPRPPW